MKIDLPIFAIVIAGVIAWALAKRQHLPTVAMLFGLWLVAEYYNLRSFEFLRPMMRQINLGIADLVGNVGAQNAKGNADMVTLIGLLIVLGGGFYLINRLVRR